ncbi:MAG: DUF92 domain-containing protein [Candidatus Hodarchaeota archaeon]
MNPLFSYFIPMVSLAIVFNIPVLILVLKKKLFTFPFGVLVAAILGIFFFIINPFFWLALLFFSLSSSLLTRIKTSEKTKVILDFEKGSPQRDTNQVLANGFVPALFVIGYALLKLIPSLTETGNVITDPFDPFLIAVFTSFAVHNADTWATEIGILSSRTPRMIVQPANKVTPGTSGGITIDGLIASLLGSAFLALLYFILYLVNVFPNINDNRFLITIITIIVAGFLGSVIDSIEGATIQGIYYCTNCQKETESNPHPRCGSNTRLHRGNQYITNDFVNLTSALIVSFLVFLFIIIIF